MFTNFRRAIGLSSMFGEILFIVAFALSCLAIWTKFRRPAWYWYCKPLPILWLIAMVGQAVMQAPTPFSVWILCGLFAGMIGDVFLISRRTFVIGLVFFLTGHIFYIVAFSTVSFQLSLWIPVVFVALALASAAMLERSARTDLYRRFRPAVWVYIATIAYMLLRAVNFDANLDEVPFIALGALLFCISDVLLAYRDFVKGSQALEGIVLVFYYAGQAVIAWGGWYAG